MVGCGLAILVIQAYDATWLFLNSKAQSFDCAFLNYISVELTAVLGFSFGLRKWKKIVIPK